MLKGENTSTPAMLGIDVYNEETISTREGLSYDHIVREYHNTRERLLVLNQQASDEILTTRSALPWGSEGNFEQITEEFSQHEMEYVEDNRKIIEEHSKA